MAYNCLTVR